MAAKGGRIDFVFLGPPYPAAGSATEPKKKYSLNANISYMSFLILTLSMIFCVCYTLFGMVVQLVDNSMGLSFPVSNSIHCSSVEASLLLRVLFSYE